MLTINELYMWKDPGYTRGCVEVPPAGSIKLPPADWILNQQVQRIRPPKVASLSAFEMSVDTHNLLYIRPMKYCFISMYDSDGGEGTGGDTFTFFAWIIDMERLSSGPYENVRITYEIDYWRTFADKVTFGSGELLRCADGSLKRPTGLRPRKWEVSGKVDDPFNATWDKFFLMITSENVKTTKLVEFPPGSGNTYPVEVEEQTGFCYYWGAVGGTPDSGTMTRNFTVSEIYSGRIDELLHRPGDPDDPYDGDPILPTSIIGCWIVPALMFTSVLGPFNGMTVLKTAINGYTITYRRSESLRENAVETNRQIPGLVGYATDDMHQCVAVDPYGNVSSMLPWGYSFSSGYVDIAIDISVEGVTYYMCDHAVGLERAMAEGCYVTFSGIPVPINSNAWSEYAYTYQRSYDKRMMEIQRNQQAVGGITGIGSRTLEGGVTGAIAGKGVIGAAVGAAVGMASPAIDYLSAGYFNDQLQKETDKLVSNQTSNVTIFGGGLGWINLTGTWKIVQLAADSVSQDEYDNNVALNGYPVDIPIADASGYVADGGPLQIANLMITSDEADLRAIAELKAQLERGVRIQENNPTGSSYPWQ